MLIRVLGSAIGLAFVALLFSLLRSGEKVPGAVWGAALIGVVFLAYGIGGPGLLTRRAPALLSRPLSTTSMIKETPTGRRSVTISDKTGQTYTFFRDGGGDTHVAEGDESQAVELEGRRIEHFTYPRGVIALFVHGVLQRGDFRFVDEHGGEWEIRGTRDEFRALLALSRE